jgi:hypothetical protein
MSEVLKEKDKLSSFLSRFKRWLSGIPARWDPDIPEDDVVNQDDGDFRKIYFSWPFACAVFSATGHNI